MEIDLELIFVMSLYFGQLLTNVFKTNTVVDLPITITSQPVLGKDLQLIPVDSNVTKWGNAHRLHIQRQTGEGHHGAYIIPARNVC